MGFFDFLRKKKDNPTETNQIEHFSATDKNVEPIQDKLLPPSNLCTGTEQLTFPDWYASISFGKSSSPNYQKAVALAKGAPQYHEQSDGNSILHQAIYSAKSDEYLQFIMLYELVGTWKSSFAVINGALIDRKVIGQLNYCYGDKCRSGNPEFCYGASEMTKNPFGCHRLQISKFNHPWWTFYYQQGNRYILDKVAMQNRIDEAAKVYQICPCFNYQGIISVLNSLPNTLRKSELESIREKEMPTLTHKIEIKVKME